MKRNQVKPEYVWKTEDIFATDADWEAELAALEPDIKAFAGYAGTLGTKAGFAAAAGEYVRLNMRFEKVYCYAALKGDEDLGNSTYNGMRDKAMMLYAAFSAASAFLSPELSALPDATLDSYIADPDLSEYDYMLKEVRRQKKHILSDKEERILAMAGEPFGSFRKTFEMIDNVDIKFRNVKNEKGETVKLTNGTYSYLLSCKDQNVRRAAFRSMFGAFKGLINTLAALYAGNVKKGNFYAKARGYKSALAAAMDGEHVPAGVYDKLIKAVHDSLPAVHEYVSYRRNILGDQHMYDLYVPVIEGAAEFKYEYEKAFDTVLKGLAPMGDEYVAMLKKAHDERWIDVEETEGKRGGAYMMGVYGVHPYVLLNHSLTTHSVFTIAHELGHAMHSYYSQATQPYIKSDYAIFVAEVASTVNEVMLLKYLVQTTEDIPTKKYLLTYYLDMFRTTVYRQTMFAEFEKKAHDYDMKGKPLTPDTLNSIYYRLNKQYYGPGVKHDALIKYEWARIPHFYTAFYVYKYATGLISAVSIARGILQDKNNFAAYKKFLSAGGSDSPYEILKLAGVDLMTDAPYEAAAREFSETLAALESL